MGRFFAPVKKEDIKKPNLKAPRARCERYVCLNKEMFKKFKKLYPHINIDWKTFKKIIIRGNEIFREGFLNNREGVVLPQGFGKLFIGAYEKSPHKNYYDWKVLHEKNVAVPQRNYESDRYFCKLFYTSFGNNYKYPFKRYWYFNPSSQTSKLVSVTFSKNWNMFIKVPKLQKLKDFEKDLYRTIKILPHEPNNGRVDFSNSQPN